jgi:hypothetical protein
LTTERQNNIWACVSFGGLPSFGGRIQFQDAAYQNDRQAESHQRFWQ